jgi:hypothetical protein
MVLSAGAKHYGELRVPHPNSRDYGMPNLKFNLLDFVLKSNLTSGQFRAVILVGLNIYHINTVFLSILTRDRDRTVTVPWPYSDRDFLNVSDRDLVQYDRSWPFTVLDRSWPCMTVPERSWPFMTVFYRFMSIYDRFMTF